MLTFPVDKFVDSGAPSVVLVIYNVSRILESVTYIFLARGGSLQCCQRAEISAEESQKT
jgi:hypothetical protein